MKDELKKKQVFVLWSVTGKKNFMIGINIKRNEVKNPFYLIFLFKKIIIKEFFLNNFTNYSIRVFFNKKVSEEKVNSGKISF